MKEGSLLIYDPQDTSYKQIIRKISCLEIAPMILHNFSVNIPEYMNQIANKNSNSDKYVNIT